MCGIAGKFYFNVNNYQDDDIHQMLSSIVHRGPDSNGIFSDRRVALGFQRLSIIDTMNGNQPLFNEDKKLVLVANGEIYNYRNLRRRLQNRGHVFRTHSDCETIIHLYEEYGVGFLEQLNGMFAFCLYDCQTETLIIARDRIGIKPMYYSVPEGLLVFGSEIKAILQSHEVDAKENTAVMDEYLCFRSLSGGGRTFFENVKIIEPGQYLRVTPASIELKEYWYPKYQYHFINKGKEIKNIAEALESSIKRQLMSDVPLGTQLSGGVDSSWVSAIAARLCPGMKSFSVGFDEPNFDETPYARIVANENDLEYHEVISNPNIFSKVLPRVIWHNDEPLTHANSVEIFNLCSYAKQHIKVLLTGEGADELFGGYPRYYLCKAAKGFENFRFLLNRHLLKMTDLFFKNRGKKPSDFLLMEPKDLLIWNSSFLLPNKVAWLMDKPAVEIDHRKKLAENLWSDKFDLIDNLLLFELKSYLQPILLRQDKMSMGASVEARVPILDNEMVNLSLTIPASEKINTFKPKAIFKLSACRDLPKKIVYKRKVGFGVPVGNWMRKGGQLEQYLWFLYDQKNTIPGISSVRLGQLIKEHFKNVADHQDILWPLINYALWRKIFYSDKGLKP